MCVWLPSGCCVVLIVLGLVTFDLTDLWVWFMWLFVIAGFLPDCGVVLS